MLQMGIAAAVVIAMSSHAFSQDGDVSKKLIERFPAADRNKDGVLSHEELHDLKQSVRKKGALQRPPEASPMGRLPLV